MKFNLRFTQQIAALAHLSLSPDQARALGAGFSESMAAVEKIVKIDTTNVAPTYQVNNLVNVWREDNVNQQGMLSQAQALANAPQTHQGYFVVERLIDHEA